LQASSAIFRQHLGTGARVAALAVLYFVTAKLSLAFAIPPGYASPLWPPSGLALAACLLMGPGIWPGIWLGATAANLTVEHSLFAAVLIGTGNTLEAICGYALLRKWSAQRLETTSDALTFLVVAAVCSLVAASIAGLPLWLSHALPWSELVTNWFTWWQGDLTGILIVTPLALAWASRVRPSWSAARIFEAACGATLTLGTTQLVFGSDATRQTLAWLPYLVVPFVLWAGLRFTQREVTTAVACVCALAVWHTVNGRGPLATGGQLISLEALLAFVITLVVTGLVLGTALQERRDAMRILRERYDQLEARVHERTRELQAVNASLQEELARRIQLEHGLQESEQRFRLMTESVVDYAIYMFDPRGRVMSWNAGAQRTKGYTAREIIGEPVSRFYLPEDVQDSVPQKAMEQAALAGRLETEGWRVRKDGSTFWASVTTTAIRDSDGLLIGFSNVTRDLTEFKRNESELLRAKLAAEQASREKSEFLANMSHELRTPLNSLLILARMLAENSAGNLTERQVKFAQTIHDSGMDLLALINDLLDLARIESGAGLSIVIAPLELRVLRGYIEGTFRHVAEAKSLYFALRISAALPPVIQTDAQRLQQVLRNLLANAFKFTREGGVRLEVAPAKSGWTPGVEALDRAAEVIAFTVTDSGIGIQPEQLGHIFQAFQQGDEFTRREFGGTGLGLSITRELVRLLRGDITVDSTPGKGSTFTLYLPLVRSATPASERTAQPTS
jgi:PAS domain S-box-containing protein